MWLDTIIADKWTILTVCDRNGRGRLRATMNRLSANAPADANQLSWLLLRVAGHGPPHNLEQSRRLSDHIFELKTRRGLRVLYFFDEGRVIVCTEVLRKPKSRELQTRVAEAEAVRARYLEAKLQGTLHVEEGGHE